VSLTGLAGTGPGGRIIERDVKAALANQRLPTTPAVETAPPAAVTATSGPPIDTDEATVIPLTRVRKLIAARMLESLQTTAQLTLNTAADASQLLEVRKRLRPMSEKRDLPKITINDLLLFVVSRVLLDFPELNAHFGGDTITQFGSVHLGFAVDTPRGLMVPVIHRADNLSLRNLAQETKRLATACTEGRINPDELTGGTFTVSNLGQLDVESFTPVLNPPQVGILGVGKVSLRAVEIDGEIEHLPHLNLSLTVNHQVVDGAPAARFLQALAQGLAEVELLMMM
jgi:pyruvate dehydrogenase E2 component (dihydrolipoamide acetyltransferase)